HRCDCARLVEPLRPAAQAAQGQADIRAGAAATLALGEGPGPLAPATVDQPHGPADADDSEADAELPRGTRGRYFGDYELRRILGTGGMGVVYRAKQLSLNRHVALKMIRAGAWAGEDEVRRFRNEAEAVANLDHPQIVTIYEVGEHDGQHYFSMKL